VLARVPDPQVPKWARALDILVLLLIVIALGVELTGGLQRTTILGVRVSATRPVRFLFWAAVIAGLRHWRFPHHPVLRRLCRDSDGDQLFFGTVQRSRRWHLAAVAGAAALLTVVMTWPQARLMHSVPDLGDPLLSTWRTAWIAHQLPRDPLHLFDANIFHPERRTLAFSDATILPGLAAAPLLWAGVHQVIVYNLLLLSSFVLAALFMFLFVRRLLGHTGAAVVAAVAFASYPYRFEHYSHLELQMSFWVPLALWAFHRTLERGALRDGLLTGLGVAGQTLSSMYYGLFLVTYLVPLALVLRLTRRMAPGAPAALAAGALLVTVLVAPLAIPYIQNRQVVGERQVGEVHYYSANPGDYLAGHFRSRAWGWMRGPDMPERHLFPGALIIVLAIVGLWPPLSAMQRAYAAALVLTFDLSLGLNGIVYPWLYDYVLPYRGLRVPARLSILVGFTLAVFAAWAVRRIVTRLPYRVPAAVVPAVLSVAILLESRPYLPLEPVWESPPPAYADLESAAIVAEFPTPADDTEGWLETRYMYFSTFHWRQLLNGNSGFAPASHALFVRHMRAFPDAGTLAYLKTRGVDYVILHGAFLTPDEYLRVRATLDSSPDVSMKRRFDFEGREGTVYRVLR
jgi:hypothetical protein